MYRTLRHARWIIGLLAGAAAAADDRGFEPLFNGRDLSGWTPVNVHPSTFTVEDGMIACTGKPIGELRTDRMYQNFILELEWRHLTPQGNAGLFVWADAITAPGVPFIRGIEVQILDGREGPTHTSDGDVFPIHGATMTPDYPRGGSRAFPTERRANASPQWNHYRVECIDGVIKLAVNGQVVTTGSDCSPRKGYICLESEGGVVNFRNIRIRELPGGPLPVQHVATADEGFESIYNGTDLTGWTLAPDGHEHWAVDDWRLTYDGRAVGPAGLLEYRHTHRNFALIVDWRQMTGDARSRQSGPVADVPPPIALGDINLPSFKAAYRPGQWTRTIVAVRDGAATASHNGVESPDFPLDVNGPITLAPRNRAMQFASIYIKPLD